MDQTEQSKSPTIKKIILPDSLIGPSDVFRLLHELEQLDEFFHQAQIRRPGQNQAPPRYSRLLDNLAVQNNLNLLDSTSRQQLINWLQFIYQSSPVVKISFSVDPPSASVQKLVKWLRQNIQDDILVRVGLQPNIGAGCVLRGTSRVFDFSLRKYFDQQRQNFAGQLDKVIAKHQAAPQGQSRQTPTPTPVQEVS